MYQVFQTVIEAEVEYNTGLTFSSNVGVFGCTDAGATNYNNAATDDDGSCIYPCTLEFVEESLTVTSPDLLWGERWGDSNSGRGCAILRQLLHRQQSFLSEISGTLVDCSLDLTPSMFMMEQAVETRLKWRFRPRNRS